MTELGGGGRGFVMMHCLTMRGFPKDIAIELTDHSLCYDTVIID